MNNLSQNDAINHILFKSLYPLYKKLNKDLIDEIKSSLDLYHCDKKALLIQETNEYSDIDLLFPIIKKYCNEKGIVFFHYSPRKFEIFSFTIISNILTYIRNNSPNSFLNKYPNIIKFISNIEKELYYDYLELIDFIVEYGKISEKKIVLFLKNLHTLNSFEKYFFYILIKNLKQRENLTSKITVFLTINTSNINPNLASIDENLSDFIQFTTIVKHGILNIEDLKENLSNIFKYSNSDYFNQTIENVFIVSKGNIFKIKETIFYLIISKNISIENEKLIIQTPLTAIKDIPKIAQILDANFNAYFTKKEIDYIEEIIWLQLNDKEIIKVFLNVDNTFFDKIFQYGIIMNHNNIDNNIYIPQPLTKLITIHKDGIYKSRILKKLIPHIASYTQNLNGFKQLEFLSETIAIIINYLDLVSKNNIVIPLKEKDITIKTISKTYYKLIELAKKINYPPETISNIGSTLINYIKRENQNEQYNDSLGRLYKIQLASYLKQLDYMNLVKTYRDIISSFHCEKIEKIRFKLDFSDILIKHKELNEFNEALKYLKEIKEDVFDSNDFLLISDYFLAISQTYFSHYKFDKALFYCEKSKKAADKTHNKAQISKIDFNLIVICMKQKKYKKVLAKLIPIRKTLDVNSQLYCQYIGVESSIYFNRMSKEKAYKLYFEQLYLARLHFDKLNILNALNKIGWLFYSEGFFKTAKKYYLDYISLAKTTKERYTISIGLYNLALLYSDTGKFDKSLRLLTEHTIISKQIKHIRALIDSISLIASIYKEQKKYTEALQSYKDIISLCASEKLMTESTMYEIADFYYKQKEFENTLIYLEKAIAQIGDSKKDNLKFNIFLLKQKTLFRLNDNKNEIISNLEKKLNDQITSPQRANLIYTLYVITNIEKYKNLAIENYRILYIENPIYKYVKKLNELGSEIAIEEL